jgi:hypothetical protein
MKSSRGLILVLIVLWGVASTSRHLSAADLYQGRVVDEETGQPLAGAVLTVVWFRSPILGFEGTRDFLSAQETVADSDGKFSLTVSPGIDWNPFSYIRKEPEIVIYQPGYEPTWAGWRERNKFKRPTEFAEALKKSATIKLPKLKSKEELRNFTNVSSLTHITVPYESIPNLIRAVNVQNKMAGLQQYPAKGGRIP